MTSSLRLVAAPFVAAPPAGARIRARLCVSACDEAVLRAVGGHLTSLAGKDLAARCAEGRLDAAGRARSRAARKRTLTAASSSRWAGAITRTSEDQVRLAWQNLNAQRTSLQAHIARIQARLARVERQLEAGTVSVVLGGKALLRVRNNLAAARLTENQWRERWDSARLFLTADGEAAKALGNETIRWHPGEGWLEIKLPARWPSWRTGRTAGTGCPAR